jgi:hypothetical protein
MILIGYKKNLVNMNEKLFKETQQILLGSELLFPDEKMVPLVRFYVEKLYFDDFSREDLLSDAFKIIKLIGDYNLTSPLEQFLLALDPKDKLSALLGLIECLTYDTLAPHVKILLKYMIVQEAQNENIEKTILSILTSFEEVGEIFKFIKSLYLEKDKQIVCKKLTVIYNFLYDQPIFERFRKLTEHFAVLDSNLQIFHFLYDQTKIPIFDRIRHINQHYPGNKIYEALSKGQIKSKLWLVEKLSALEVAPSQVTHILCGWYGTLADCINLSSWGEKISHMISYDVDEGCKEIAETFHDIGLQFQFEAKTKDIFKIDYSNLSQPLCLINTSCEHIDEFSKWFNLIPQGTLLVLQNNNFFKLQEHINCVKNLDEFKDMAPLTKILFEGELKLDKYTRYMLIGYK